MADPVIELFTDFPFAHALCFPDAIPRRGSLQAIEALVERKDLTVAFQPIVELSTGEVFAYEALTRCDLPELRNPEVLFERASTWGCVGRLGRMAREIAAQQWTGVPVFLNVHPRELEERWLVRPDDPIFTHDSTVYIEVTEGVPLAHFELCRSVLRELRQRMDARLVIDDLGAGFSNLKLIADLEPDVVKLDHGLVEGLHRERRRQVLVGNIVRMCTELGAQVVAEGIEERDELQAVRDCGAQFGQGYLLGRPDKMLPARKTGSAPPAT